MRTYTSVNPITLEQLVQLSGWVEGPEDDSLTDGHDNVVYVTETDDGHLQLDVDEGCDASDLLDLVSFHLEDPED